MALEPAGYTPYKTVKSEENPSLFGFLPIDSCSARATRGSICHAQTLGGPALSPSARAGVSTLSLEVRWAVAKDISVTAMFRIHLVMPRGEALGEAKLYMLL